MTQRTVLHPEHLAAGGRMTDFGGWEMPLHYGSQLNEHHAVRNDAGVFDVSHMKVVDVADAGTDAQTVLRRLFANDVAKLAEPGRGLYTCMLNPDGGIRDDLIVYRTGAGNWRIVFNAATGAHDLAWLRRQAADASISIAPREDLAMLAVQGPRAVGRLLPELPESLRGAVEALRPFHCVEAADTFVARTGYTGEDGVEVLVPAERGVALWRRLLARGVQPCGLGARDSLRLEAGLHLYGQDMDTDTSPLECGLGWTVAWDPTDRDFIGREALEAQRERGVTRRLAGLRLEARGVMRHGHHVFFPQGEGIVTSGGFSPTMQCSIALARVPVDAGEDCEVEIRGSRKRARVLKLPFVRHGRVLAN